MVSEIATRVMVKTLRKAGWTPVRSGSGSHTVWACRTGRHQVTVPDGHTTISAGVRRTIEKATTGCDCKEER